MENTYWNGKGKYSKEYNEMFDKLVPSRGDATTQIGQVLRACSNLYYEYYNNGNCNVFVEVFVERHVCNYCGGTGLWGEDDEDNYCMECDGTGYIEEYDLVITDTYKEYINIIKNYAASINTEKAKNLQKQINNLEKQLRNDSEMCQDKCIYEELYEGLVDSVMEALLEMPQTMNLK